MEIDACDVVVHGRFWRFIQFPLTRIVIATVSVIAVVLLLQGIAAATHFKPHSTIGGLFAALITIAALIATYAAYVHLVERRPVAEFGMRGAVLETATGVVIGGILFALTMLVLWLSGVATIRAGAGSSVLIYGLLGALETAVLEEILFRGIVFRIVEESWGTWIALAISAVVFGALHGFNPGASLLSSAAIALEAGVLLAAVYAYTRRLWMAIGLHAAWDFTESDVFGASDSGHRAPGVLSSHFHGSVSLTGGQFGPEASIVAVLICLMAAVVFILLVVRRRHIVQPFWRRRTAIGEATVAAG